jgi:regulator of cell morphogenesis and NO signaling
VPTTERPTHEMPPIDVDRTLADLVSERPARARVFERLGLDYCCKGRRSLADATADAGLDVGGVAAQLADVTDPSGTDVDQLGPVALVDHILDTHHRYLHEELPLIDALAAKVRDVHGARHPELEQVAALVAEIRADLEPHLRKEEMVLFPAIRQLATGPCDLPFGSVANPIAVMLREHDRAGGLLEQLREATDGYTPPEDGCTSYRTLYDRLAELERDTHRHVHLENNVLFPAVVALEA